VRLYLDTSAIVPLLLGEGATATCRRLWDEASLVTTSAVAHVEATSAIARAVRGGRIIASEAEEAHAELARRWLTLCVVPADGPRLTSASVLATKHGLRGFDAVHCAAARAVADDDVLAASGDHELLDAWRAEGLAVVDTTR
jgi:predicted nucleic acid-binding protein